MKSYFYSVAVLAVVIPSLLRAQDEGFLYGKVHTTDNKVYEGPIRWGKEEVYWVDVFNAGKEDNPNLRYLSSRERDELYDRQNSWNSWGGDLVSRFVSWGNSGYGDDDFEHQFACQFGAIKTVTPSGRKYVTLEMRDGKMVHLKGEGYNDVGLDVQVMDEELGAIEVAWVRIDKVVFMPAPKNISRKFGSPLYGTVQTFGKTVTGFIQWDHDERLHSDKLDGDTEDGDLSIEFGKIASIERRGSRSFVTLKSGRELLMRGSNDVDNSNRGIIIMNSDWTAIDVPWSEFEKVTFTEAPRSPAIAYGSFESPSELMGTVFTNDGKTLAGTIVFDLDEAYSYELLQGRSGEIKYTVPFSRIKRIEPLSVARSEIELRSGEKISLFDEQDVNERNQGVLVFSQGSDRPVYIAWGDVKAISFQ